MEPWEWIWDNFDQLRNRYLVIRSVFSSIGGGTDTAALDDENSHSIVVTGPAGVGKSTLGRYLGGDFDFLIDADKHYVESVGVERSQLDASGQPDDAGVRVYVLPGQRSRRYKHKPQLESIRNGAVDGVIVVFGYGYEGIAEDHERVEGIVMGDDGLPSLDGYLEANRENEKMLISEFADAISAADRSMWLLTIVNKEDLWWGDRQRVRAHYEEVLREPLERISNSLGTRRIRHQHLEISLLISCLRSKNAVLAENVAGYDSYWQVLGLRRLHEAVYDLLGGDWNDG